MGTVGIWQGAGVAGLVGIGTGLTVGTAAECILEGGECATTCLPIGGMTIGGLSSAAGGAVVAACNFNDTSSEEQNENE